MPETNKFQARIDGAAREIKSMDTWVKDNLKRGLDTERFGSEARALGRKFTTSVQKFAPVKNAFNLKVSASEQEALVILAESIVFEAGEIADEVGNLASEVEAYEDEMKP